MNETQATQFPVTAGWYKSSYGAANNECVEGAVHMTGIALTLTEHSGGDG
ncbi:DUF397 domain-containing protein [Streptomyces sp. NPDC048392]